MALPYFDIRVVERFGTSERDTMNTSIYERGSFGGWISEGIAYDIYGLEGSDFLDFPIDIDGDFLSGGPGDDFFGILFGSYSPSLRYVAMARVNGDEGFDQLSWFKSDVNVQQFTPRTTLLTSGGDINGRPIKNFIFVDDSTELINVNGTSFFSSAKYYTRTLRDGPITNSPQAIDTSLGSRERQAETDWFYRQSFPALANSYQPLSLNSNTVQLLYVAYYGRPADPSGAQFWSRVTRDAGFTYAPRVGDGLTQSEKPLYDRIVVDFGNSIESTALFRGLSNEQTVDLIYNFCFNRNSEPDPVTGINYWVSQLQQGNIAPSQAAAEIALGARAMDLTILGNKIKSADTFTASINTPTENANYSSPSQLATRISRSWLGDYGPFVATFTEAQRVQDLYIDIDTY